MPKWSDVDWDLWHSEVAFCFLKNKEGAPDSEHCRWHWLTDHGPAQTYYKMSTKHAVQVQDGEGRECQTA